MGKITITYKVYSSSQEASEFSRRMAYITYFAGIFLNIAAFGFILIVYGEGMYRFFADCDYSYLLPSIGGCWLGLLAAYLGWILLPFFSDAHCNMIIAKQRFSYISKKAVKEAKKLTRHYNRCVFLDQLVKFLFYSFFLFLFSVFAIGAVANFLLIRQGLRGWLEFGVMAALMAVVAAVFFILRAKKVVGIKIPALDYNSPALQPEKAAMTTCKFCGSKVSAEYSVCAMCGADLD